MNRTKTKQLLGFSLAIITMTIFFQNCGSGFQAMQTLNSSSLTAPLSEGDVPIDPNADLTIYSRSASVLQGGTLAFKVELNRAAPVPVAVNFKIVDGTAIAGSDFQVTGAVVEIPAGTLSGVIEVKTLTEVTNDIHKRLTLEIGSVTLGKIGQKVATGTIRRLKQFYSRGSSASLTCITTEQDTLKCKGSNQYGQLGDGTFNSAAGFVDVVNLKDVRQVVVGNTAHVCALTFQGTVKCWGNWANTAVPEEVPGITDATQIVAGDASTCVLTSLGGVKCWGFALFGNSGYVKTPTDIAGLTEIVQIAHGGYHACALDRTGAVKCWGKNRQTGTFVNSPVPVDTGLTGIKQISAGYATLNAVTSTGTLKILGNDLNPTIPYDVPGASDIKSLSTAGFGAPVCMITNAENLKCLSGSAPTAIDFVGATNVMRAIRDCVIGTDNIAMCISNFNQQVLTPME